MGKRRSVTLAKRTAHVTNLNFQPEKHGEELVARADLSLEFLLEEREIAHLIVARTNVLLVLWDKGEPQLEELKKLVLDLKAEGNAELGNGESEHTFEDAVLSKVSIEPMIGFKAKVRCSLRVNPGESIQALAQMRMHGSCALTFKGRRADEQDDQGQLDV